MEIAMVVRTFALVAMAILVGQPVVAEEDAPAGSTKTGEELYAKQGCYECHGWVAQGANFSGPRIAPPVLPYESFLEQIRQPRSDMPPYSERVLTDKQLADIYAFLQTIPEPPDRKTIPLLQ